MGLRDNPLMGLIAGFVIMSAIVAFGMGEVSVLDVQFADYAWLLLPMSLLIGYLLSDYNTDKMDDWEMLAVLIPIAALAAMEFVNPVGTFVSDNQPATGIALTLITLVSFYAILD
jgi:hypothetical protein